MKGEILININLWFARDIHNEEIVQIFDANCGNKYTCPICNSEVIPKALVSSKITPHFAHIDRSKCSQESMIHWWYKHKFIDKGDVFTIKTDKEIQFICADTDVEVEYELSNGKYKPDLVVRTECGNEIVFEMANTNKKKVEDYIDRWIELNKIVVEVDIKSLVNDKKEFDALYYKGKCFNFNKRDGGYYNTIGKLKERMVADGNYEIEKIKQLDWFWREVEKYNKDIVSIEHMSNLIDRFYKDNNQYCIIDKILKSSNCSKIYKDYKKFKTSNDFVLFNYYSDSFELSSIVRGVNSKIKQIDNRFDLKMVDKIVPITKSYFHGSRKHMYKSKIVDNRYKFSINFYFKNRKLISVPVTNGFIDIVDKSNYLFDKSKDCMIKKYKCTECNSFYSIDKDYLNYLIKRNYKLPKRCESCRKRRKLSK